jgi:hypothetical protein
MLTGFVIINTLCVILGGVLLRTLSRRPADVTPVESFAAVLEAIRPAGGTRSANQPIWIPWSNKETRTC